MTQVCRLHEEVIGSFLLCSEERDQGSAALLCVVFVVVFLNMKNPREVSGKPPNQGKSNAWAHRLSLFCCPRIQCKAKPWIARISLY